MHVAYPSLTRRAGKGTFRRLPHSGCGWSPAPLNIRPVPLEVAAPIDLAREPPFRLGDTEVRPPTLELVRAGRAASVEPKVMQALVALARHLGQVTSRDELVETCWAGRFVSEDAIQRIIAKLRQAAEQHAGGDFAIETIPRVGYRLVLAGARVAESEIAPAKARPKRTWMALAALALVGVLVVGALAWRALAPSGAAATVSLADFKAVGPGVPADLPVTFVETVRDAFGEDNDLTLRDRGADYVLHGLIRRVDDKYRYAVRLEDTRDGAMIWATSPELPAQDPRATRKMAVSVTQVVRCGLKAAAAHPRRLPTHTLALFMQYCDASIGVRPDSERALGLARRVVAESSDFSWGWSAVAASSAALYVGAPLAAKPAYAAEVNAAAARALRLDPTNGQAYEMQAYILPLNALAQREALFKRAVQGHLTGCGCELGNMGNFLSSVGRLREAQAYYRRFYDLQPLYVAADINLAISYDNAGQWQKAEDIFAKVTETYGPRRGDRYAMHASYRGDWGPARRYAESAPPALGPALGGAVDALASGRPDQIAAAGRALEAVERQVQGGGLVDGVFLADTLVALGARDGAFRRLEIVAERGAASALFMPRERALSHDPRYAAILKRSGLMDYWRNSHTRPDLCGDPDPPAFCATL